MHMIFGILSALILVKCNHILEYLVLQPLSRICVYVRALHSATKWGRELPSPQAKERGKESSHF